MARGIIGRTGVNGIWRLELREFAQDERKA